MEWPDHGGEEGSAVVALDPPTASRLESGATSGSIEPVVREVFERFYWAQGRAATDVTAADDEQNLLLLEDHDVDDDDRAFPPLNHIAEPEVTA